MQNISKMLPKETQDGNYTFYNFDVKDISYSNIGAYAEALTKFVLPSVPISKEIKIDTELLFYESLKSEFDINATLKNYAENLPDSRLLKKSYLPE